jgi:hypothetical protein
MGRFSLVVLAGFLVGAPAAPASLVFGLPRPVVLLAVLLGAQGCFVVSLFAMDRLRALWSRLAVSRPPRPPSRAAARASALLDRIGPVGFGLIAPALLGTWGSALLGTGLGLGRWRLLVWLTAGTALWSTALLLGVSAFLDQLLR